MIMKIYSICVIIFHLVNTYYDQVNIPQNFNSNMNILYWALKTAPLKTAPASSGF
jgi:hypothetical protein